VIDGFQKLLPYFVPVYDAIIERSVAAKHWHADETSWKVFETIEGKKNHRWFLWIFHNKETVVYKMHPTRSSKALLEHFGEDHAGGTLNVDRPDIPMDNNIAERGLRSSVVGRKNYYGSGATWSAELAAALFTLFKTLKLWNINVHTWLLNYFYECALVGGAPPEDITKFLPWGMTEEQINLFSQPPKLENSE
jgi:hypothetical protein